MEKKSHKDYLEKTFIEEINYKIWSTKGARFNANRRLLRIENLSNICISMLSIYLIMMGLLSVYNIYSSNNLTSNIIAYSITCLSILILVFGQIENAKKYSSKANQFHKCGLELSALYNELRIFKTLNTNSSSIDKQKFAKDISGKYQKILEQNENHEPIDYEMFKTYNSEYYSLTWFMIRKIRIKHYIKTSLVYHIFIFIPPIVIISFLILNHSK